MVSFWGYDVTVLPRAQPERVLPYLNVADVVIVPSQFLAEVVRSLGVDPRRIRVVPGSVDGQFFCPTPVPPEPRVAFVGRFVAKKGVAELLSAWSAVRREIPPAELVLLGFGDDLPADRTPGIQIRTPDHTDPRRQVRDLIRWCRIYVSPSRTGPDGDSESQHIGNLEAMATGRAVLTTDHGPIPEFVAQEDTGVLVPQGDQRALADALIALVNDVPRCQRLADRAAVAARRFHVDRISAAHDRVYEDLARSSRALA